MSAPDRTTEPTPLTPAPKRGGIFSRLSAGHIVMIVAALLAALVNLNLLQSRDETFLVSVAAVEILPGQTISTDDFASAEIRATGEVLSRLILFDTASQYDGLIAVRPIAAGDLVAPADFQQAAAPLEQRAMSIPVDEELAVGGSINSSDLVDIISVDDGVAHYVVVGAQVLATPARDDSNFSGGGQWFVTVAVTGQEALEIASALDIGEVHVIRSTGADAPEFDLFDPATLLEEEDTEPDSEEAATLEPEPPAAGEGSDDGGS